MKLRGTNGTTSALQTDTGTDIVKINESTGATEVTTSLTIDSTTASTTPSTGAVIIAGGVGVGGAVNTTGAITSAAVVQGTQLTSSIADGTTPLLVTSTTKVTNLNVDRLDSAHASATPTAATIPIADAYGRLDSWISYQPYYGVSWNESTDSYGRTGALAGIAVGVKAPDGLLPVHVRMRRCVLSDDGNTKIYLNANNSNFYEDGTASVLTGAAGQVMVEIPKFWHRYNYSGTTHTWEVSPVALSGFSVHPAFLNGATERANIYVGAYEATVYSFANSRYEDYTSAYTPNWLTGKDKLASVSLKRPVTNGKRSEFRMAAANRATNWTIETILGR